MKKIFFSSALILLVGLSLFSFPKLSLAEKFFALDQVPPAGSGDWSLSSPEGSVKVVFPDGVDSSDYTRMTDISDKDQIFRSFGYDASMTPITDLYSVRVENKEASATLSGVKVVLMYTPDNTFKHPYYYNWDQKNFVQMDCVNDVKNNLFTCDLPDRDQVILAIFSENEISGKASWYVNPKYKTQDMAASTDFPIGTKVKVVNLDNNKSVVVTIKDYGPKRCAEWTDEEQRKMGPCQERVLDLSKVAFKKIAAASQGMVNIKITPAE